MSSSFNSDLKIVDGQDIPKLVGTKRRAKHPHSPMDVRFLGHSTRRTPSHYRQAGASLDESVPEDVQVNDEEVAQHAAEEMGADNLTIVPAQSLVSLNLLGPDEDFLTYVPVPGTSGAALAPYLSVDNIQAIATSFVQM